MFPGVEQMSVAINYLRSLTEADLYFIVTSLVNKRQDYQYLCRLLKDKPDLIEIMLDDERLFPCVLGDESIILKISPYLVFSILLSQARREIEKHICSMELVNMTERMPVFDVVEIKRTIANQDLNAYLAHMLSTFTRAECAAAVAKGRGLPCQRNYNDLNFDEVLEIASRVEAPNRFSFYKRLGDIALFITGIYPDYLSGKHDEVKGRLPFQMIGGQERALLEYEHEGRRYYNLAASCPEALDQGLTGVFVLLADNLAMVRRQLYYLVEKYLSRYRSKWFA
jgi:hypothetical protein